MVILRIAILALVFAVTGCTSSSRMMMTTEIPQHRSNYKKMPVFFQNPPRKSRPIALITVARDGENALYAVEMLKMEAAEVGADALANVEVNFSSGIFPTLRVQGLAVKYVD